jgi:hypothetical protein
MYLYNAIAGKLLRMSNTAHIANFAGAVVVSKYIYRLAADEPDTERCEFVLAIRKSYGVVTKRLTCSHKSIYMDYRVGDTVDTALCLMSDETSRVINNNMPSIRWFEIEKPTF